MKCSVKVCIFPFLRFNTTAMKFVGFFEDEWLDFFLFFSTCPYKGSNCSTSVKAKHHLISPDHYLNIKCKGKNDASLYFMLLVVLLILLINFHKKKAQTRRAFCMP